jgi:hypothetical protein
LDVQIEVLLGWLPCPGPRVHAHSPMRVHLVLQWLSTGARQIEVLLRAWCNRHATRDPTAAGKAEIEVLL